jgi:arylsulfatase A-like enzyme
VDFWPTLAGLLGTEAPQNLPGINLADEQAVARRSQIFGESSAHNITDVEHTDRNLQHRFMVDGWWKVIAPDSRNLPDAKPELYDLKTDPWEKNDLAAAQAEKLSQMLGRLDQWWKPEAKK